MFQAILNFSNSEKWTTRVSFSNGKTPLELPKILICNFNRFSNEKLRQNKLSDDFTAYLFSRFVVKYHVQASDKNTLLKGEREYREFQKRTNNQTFNEIVETLGAQCPIICLKKDYKDCVSYQDGGERSWFSVRKIRTPEFGFCYQVEFNESHRTVEQTGTY